MISVCFVSKGQKAKSGQSGQRSKDKVQRTKKISAWGMDVCCVCVVQ